MASPTKTLLPPPRRFWASNLTPKALRKKRLFCLQIWQFDKCDLKQHFVYMSLYVFRSPRRPKGPRGTPTVPLRPLGTPHPLAAQGSGPENPWAGRRPRVVQTRNAFRYVPRADSLRPSGFETGFGIGMQKPPCTSTAVLFVWLCFLGLEVFADIAGFYAAPADSIAMAAIGGPVFLRTKFRDIIMLIKIHAVCAAPGIICSGSFDGHGNPSQRPLRTFYLIVL